MTPNQAKRAAYLGAMNESDFVIEESVLEELLQDAECEASERVWGYRMMLEDDGL
jgi:hypothetical protein